MKNQPTNVERATVLVALENKDDQRASELALATGMTINTVNWILEGEERAKNAYQTWLGRWRLFNPAWRETVRG